MNGCRCGWVGECSSSQQETTVIEKIIHFCSIDIAFNYTNIINMSIISRVIIFSSFYEKEVSNNDNVNKKNSNNVYNIRGIPKKRKCTKYKVTRIILSIAVLSHTSWLLYKASSARLLAWSRSYHNKIFLLHPYSPCLRCTLPLHFTVHEIKTRRQCWPRERNVRSRLCTSQTASPLWKYCSCCNTGYVLKGGEGIFNH